MFKEKLWFSNSKTFQNFKKPQKDIQVIAKTATAKTLSFNISCKMPQTHGLCIQ